MSTDGLTRTERERAAALGIVRETCVGRGKIEVLPKFRVRSLADVAALYAALDTRARRVPREVCLAAAPAIATNIPDSELRPDNILPIPLSPTLYPSVSEATARAIVAQGFAGVTPAPGAVAERTHLRRSVVARQQDNAFTQRDG